MAVPKAYLFGDSHAEAVQRAAMSRASRGQAMPITLHRLRKEKGDVTIGDTSFEEFLELIGPLDPTDLVISQIGGNQHAVFSTIQHPQRFDFMEPAGRRQSVDAHAELIPSRILADMFDRGIRGGDGKKLQRLREATGARVVHLLPPPPKRDNDFIQQYHETKFAKEGIGALGVSAPELRLKFWRLQRRTLQLLCDELGIELMGPPQSALDADGYLDRAYYANDATHANRDYGELLLSAVEERYLNDKKDAA